MLKIMTLSSPRSPPARSCACQSDWIDSIERVNCKNLLSANQSQFRRPPLSNIDAGWTGTPHHPAGSGELLRRPLVSRALLSGLLYVSMVAAGVSVRHYLFAAMNLLPEKRPAIEEMIAFEIDYIFNLMFILISELMVWLHIHETKKSPASGR
ncbi:MAG: hypothetical protein KY459_02875 [Acidobacteria bacterium]|nr:hypothetical protein [Acidobacteriota bacterium]